MTTTNHVLESVRTSLKEELSVQWFPELGPTDMDTERAWSTFIGHIYHNITVLIPNHVAMNEDALSLLWNHTMTRQVFLIAGKNHLLQPENIPTLENSGLQRVMRTIGACLSKPEFNEHAIGLSHAIYLLAAAEDSPENYRTSSVWDAEVIGLDNNTRHFSVLQEQHRIFLRNVIPMIASVGDIILPMRDRPREVVESHNGLLVAIERDYSLRGVGATKVDDVGRVLLKNEELACLASDAFGNMLNLMSPMIYEILRRLDSRTFDYLYCHTEAYGMASLLRFFFAGMKLREIAVLGRPVFGKTSIELDRSTMDLVTNQTYLRTLQQQPKGGGEPGWGVVTG